MKCPVCNRDVNGKSCSYCGCLLEEKNDNTVDEQAKKKEKVLMILLSVLSVLAVIAFIFSSYITAFIAVVLTVYSLYYWNAKVKKIKAIQKSKANLYLCIIIFIGLFSCIPYYNWLYIKYCESHADEKYSEMLQVALPEAKAKYSYNQDIHKGYHIKRYEYELTDEQIEILIKSNDNFELTGDNNNKVFDYWYGESQSDYYLMYNVNSSDFSDVENLKKYHVVLIVVIDNFVYVDEITQNPIS